MKLRVVPEDGIPVVIETSGAVTASTMEEILSIASEEAAEITFNGQQGPAVPDVVARLKSLFTQNGLQITVDGQPGSLQSPLTNGSSVYAAGEHKGQGFAIEVN
jgi:hypothetical protein